LLERKIMKKILKLKITATACLVLGILAFAGQHWWSQGKTEQSAVQRILVETVYGDFEVTEPILIDLFKHPVMERIKHVEQYGPRCYVDKKIQSYSRYDHCVGVWALLRLYGASLQEQVAGLLHDASHTVFSHVGDYLFKNSSQLNSYQDSIHAWYLTKFDLPELCAKHGMSFDSLMHKDQAYAMLEQNLPNLCADRIEYNIKAALMNGFIKKDEVKMLLKDLKFEDGQWFFTDAHYARLLGKASLNGTLHEWGGPAVYTIDSNAARALERAMEIDLVSFDEIHFSQDNIIWERLCASSDPIIQSCIQKMQKFNEQFVLVNADDNGDVIKTKYRGIDPLIKTVDGKLEPLTLVDNAYAQDVNYVKEQTVKGWHVVWADSKNNIAAEPQVVVS
jgi:hypothetical protein